MGLRKRFSKKLAREVWGYRFWVKGHCHSGETGLPATERNRPAAEQIKSDHRALVIDGKPERPRLIPFSDAADQFLAWSKAEHEDKPNTWKRQSVSLASLRHFLAERYLGEINAGDLENYKSWRRRRGIEEVTIRHDLHALSQLFQLGQKHGWCGSNPVRDVKVPSDKNAVNEKVLTDEEERIYFAAAKRNSTLFDVTRLMLLQGPRPQEVLSLLKENWDYENKTLRIPNGKSRAARRTLHLTDESMLLLGRRMAGDSRQIFPGKDARRPYSYSGLVGAHNRVLDETGLSFDIYSLRHTFATRFYESTKDIAALAKVLGHAKLSTVERYVHPTETHVREAMRTYEEGLRPMDPEVVQ